ncbi:MAG TPA: type II toxin-antitoxin system VapC family toxin [Oscillatoriaceae cyanobacterium M33_DOE_052]|uniref:Ribonuclease VapC n=1 Tax=Planktothricoides sp. SpSt-374 TaxID=2282167 RepID=A0A7C3VEG6_9CYAN|nr:type II toxin-antitoxin system VapC family toxin [Oscillatoriaceae cyanobacterium M33_DOE_052]
MISKYLFDTNILIYYFNGEPVLRPIFDEIQTGASRGFYCPLTWVELLCYPGLTKHQENEMREFLRILRSVSLTESVLDCATEIRRNRVKLADALVAACALNEGCQLVTRNVADFKRIDGLILVNPFDK